MASANSQAKLVRAEFHPAYSRYWCEPCEEYHPGESPDHLGDGYYLGKSPKTELISAVVGNKGGEDDKGYLYVLTDGLPKVGIYTCKEGITFDEEDWTSYDSDSWECTFCGSTYTEEDYGDEAKLEAECCCEAQKDKREATSGDLIENKLTDPSVAYTMTNATTILSGTITSINEATGAMTVSVEQLNKALGIPEAPKPEVIPVDDVTADAFK